MNKKLLFGIIFFVLILSSIVVAEGKIREAFDTVKDVINIRESYERNPAFWDFFLFSLIYNLVIWIGTANWFKDQKVAAYLLALVLGVVFGLASVKAGMSVKFFVPFVENFLFFLVVGILTFILHKFKMNVFLALILSLVVTFVMFNVAGLFGGVQVEGTLDLDSLDFWSGDPTLDDVHEKLEDIMVRYDIDIKAKDDIHTKTDKLMDVLDKKRDEVRQKINDTPDETFLEDELQEINEERRLVSQLDRLGTRLEKEKVESEEAAILEKISNLAEENDISLSGKNTIDSMTAHIESELKKKRAAASDEEKEEFDDSLEEINKIKKGSQGIEQDNVPDDNNADSTTTGTSTSTANVDYDFNDIDKLPAIPRYRALIKLKEQTQNEIDTLNAK